MVAALNCVFNLVLGSLQLEHVESRNFISVTGTQHKTPWKGRIKIRRPKILCGMGKRKLFDLVLKLSWCDKEG